MQAYEKLEQELAEWAGVDYMVVCSSGTAALHLAFEALELPLGSRIVVPEFTMIACARAVVLAGHVPVFVDCGDDLLMDRHKLDEIMERSSSIAAILAVHIYGRQCDMDHLLSHGVPVVEDLAEAHGVAPSPKSAAAIWSFYRNKIVAGEEGGAVCFPNNYGKYTSGKIKRCQIARELRCQGFTDSHDFIHRPRGCNYRLSNANAKLILRNGLYQFDIKVKERRERESWYNEILPKEQQRGPRDAPWVYDLFHPVPSMAVKALNDNGIAARRAFAPMSMQPEFRQNYKHLKAYQAYNSVMYLPLDPSLTKEQCQRAARLATA